MRVVLPVSDVSDGNGKENWMIQFGLVMRSAASIRTDLGGWERREGEGGGGERERGGQRAGKEKVGGLGRRRVLRL